MTTNDSVDYKLLTILKKTLTYKQPHALRHHLKLNPTKDNYEHQDKPHHTHVTKY